MDQIAKPQQSDDVIAESFDDVQDVNAMIESAWAIENLLVDFRNRRSGTIHPWAMPSLDNAIGAIQACQSHLRAAKHHIETPDPAAFVAEK